MAALEVNRSSPVSIPVQAHHVLPKLFECLIKGLLVVLSLSFSIANQALAVSDENQNTPVVNSIQRGYISNRVAVHEHQSELIAIEDLVRLWLKVSLRTCSEVSGVHVVVDLAHLLPVGENWVQLFLVLLPQVEVVLHLLAPAEFFEHDHLVAAVLRALSEQGLFLLVLSGIDDVCPLLLILCFEVAEEFVE